MATIHAGWLERTLENKTFNPIFEYQISSDKINQLYMYFETLNWKI